MRVHTLALAFLLSLSLVACGGGGGGSEGSSSTPTAQTPVPQTVPQQPAQPATVGSLQSEVPAPTYAQNTGELEAFSYLNRVRTQCGFGAVAQNTKLDTAARAHSNFLLEGSSANTYLVGHYESDTNNPFYRGNAPSDRASAASYGASVREILTASVNQYATASPVALLTDAERGSKAMRDLVNTVGHARDAFSGARVVGFGDEQKSFTAVAGGLDLTTVHYRFGALLGPQEGTQLLGAGQVASYPCAASQDVEYAFAPATEDPNPFPAITSTSVEVGPPIYLRADPGAVLNVEAKSLKDAAGVEVAVRTDVGALDGHEFFMVPSSALLPNTVYTVSLKGTANGVAFNRTFTFKTKS